MNVRENVKFSVGIWAFTPCGDRFSPQGYRKPLTMEEQFELLSKVEELDGVILQCPNVVNEDSVGKIKELLEDADLEAAAVDANLFSGEFAKGGFTNPDPGLRQKAIEIGTQTIRIAKELSTHNVGLWLGQDGFDYPFQANHLKLWQWEINAIRKIAAYDPSVRICIEYKVKEPRHHILIGDVAKGILTCREVEKDNVGITLDFGHALMSNENPTESAWLLHKYKKLYSVHFNDSYRVDDDDMIAGTVHSWETLELLMALEEMQYKGWYGFDIFPYREDIVESTDLCIQNIKGLRRLLKKINVEELKRLQGKLDFVKIHKLLREILYSD